MTNRENKNVKYNIYQYYIWCGFRTISLVKSVTWYTEYLMYFLCSEETRLLVSIFTYRYIDAMLLNLEAPVPQQTKRKNFNLSVLKNFIKFLNFQKILKFLIWKKKKFNVQNFKISWGSCWVKYTSSHFAMPYIRSIFTAW